ncbi:hypothetical protein WA026_009138 [Henosepilachna vigintioctopunctata]|uniref:Major facilitator superfamily (MFS) profile domain-containing protein n=1 Tax=Henosepilachna vigintioctopunctata TaxID=420089 RepID=A0AAW1UP07_9CUCU
MNKPNENPLGRVITSSENSMLASLNTWAACLGAMIFGSLTSYFGRKTLLIATGIPPLLAYLAMAWAEQIWIFYICRILTGISLGGAFSILPMYCGELADANNRGILGSSIAVFVNLGMLIPYTVGPYISFFWFHIILALIPTIYIPLFFFFAPESPHFLIKKSFSEAEAVLKKLRGRDDVSKILEDIRNEIENTSKGSVMDILNSKALRKGFLIGLGGFTFMVLTGTGIVASYNERIFKIANVGIPPELGPIIVAIAQLITTVVVSSIADNYPRRLLLFISFFGVALVEIPFGIYFFLKERKVDVSSVSWLPLVCLVLYVIIYNVGIGPVMFIFLGELFPARVKGIAISCLVVYNWGSTSMLTMLFNTLNDSIGMGYMFWMFAVCCFMASTFIKYFVVETKGKTFQEIQEALSE